MGWVHPTSLGWNQPISCLVTGMSSTQFSVWLEDTVGSSGSIPCLVRGMRVGMEYDHLFGEITIHCKYLHFQSSSKHIHERKIICNDTYRIPCIRFKPYL